MVRVRGRGPSAGTESKCDGSHAVELGESGLAEDCAELRHTVTWSVELPLNIVDCRLADLELRGYVDFALEKAGELGPYPSQFSHMWCVFVDIWLVVIFNERQAERRDVDGIIGDNKIGDQMLKGARGSFEQVGDLDIARPAILKQCGVDTFGEPCRQTSDEFKRATTNLVWRNVPLSCASTVRTSTWPGAVDRTSVNRRGSTEVIRSWRRIRRY